MGMEQPPPQPPAGGSKPPDWGEMGETGEGLSCEFPAKWISADGLMLWSVFSVYGEGGKQGINAHDKFNLVKTTLGVTDAKSAGPRRRP